jgi:hypothetical protein
MADVQNIKAPIGEYNLPAGFAILPQPGHKLFKRHFFFCCRHHNLIAVL